MGICVSDLERSTRFYTEVLGFRELFTMTMGNEVAATMEQRAEPAIRFESRMLARGDLRIELLHWLDPESEGDRTRRPMNRYGMTHLCFRVDDVDDVAEEAKRWGGDGHDATRSELENAGVDGGPVTLLYLTDPDGIRIECMSGTPDLSRSDPRAG